MHENIDRIFIPLSQSHNVGGRIWELSARSEGAAGWSVLVDCDQQYSTCPYVSGGSGELCSVRYIDPEDSSSLNFRSAWCGKAPQRQAELQRALENSPNATIEA